MSSSIGNTNVDFIPSSKYTNSKAGYVFKKGDKGLGYYSDPYCSDKVGLHSSSNSKSSNDSTLPGNLTRIPISIDDDDDANESGMIDKVPVSNEIKVDLKSDKVSNSLNTKQSESFKNLGNQSMSRKNYSEAINYYTKSTEADPDNIPAFSNRALAYLEIKVIELILEFNIKLYRNFILSFKKNIYRIINLL